MSHNWVLFCGTALFAGIDNRPRTSSLGTERVIQPNRTFRSGYKLQISGRQPGMKHPIIVGAARIGNDNRIEITVDQFLQLTDWKQCRLKGASQFLPARKTRLVAERNAMPGEIEKEQIPFPKAACEILECVFQLRHRCIHNPMRLVSELGKVLRQHAGIVCSPRQRWRFISSVVVDTHK